MNKLLIFTILTFLGIQLSAQENTKNTFSLKEAQDYAVLNNANVKNAQLDQIIAKKKVWETTAMGLPQVSGAVDYSNTLSELPTISFNPAMEPIQVGEKQNATFSVTASQLVFSGPYIVGLQASNAYKDFSGVSSLKAQADVKETITQLYYAILIAEKNKEILEEIEKTMLQTVDETNKMHDVGFVEETTAKQIELNLNNIKNSIKSIERQKEVAKNYLKIQMGMTSNEQIELTDKFQDIIAALNFENIISQEFSLEKNIDYMLLDNQERLTNLSLKREKSELLPSISAYVRYQKLAKEPEINFTPEMLLGVSLNVPIFGSGMKVSKIQQAKLELDKTRNIKEQVAENLNNSVQQAKFDFTNAYEKFNTEEKNLELSKKIFEDSVEKFKKGMFSSIELTQVQSQYLTTQTNYFTAIFELLNAKNTLDKALNNY